MHDDRTCQLLRAILTAAREYSPGPVTLDDVANHPLVRNLIPARPELTEQWNELSARGYLENFADSNGELRLITVKGRDQIMQTVDRDFFIWGRHGQPPKHTN